MRGLIRCSSRQTGKETSAYKWVQTGKTFKRQGCGKWNVYVGTGNPEKIDTTLRCCGRRVKFQPWRKNERGRPRPVKFLERPDHMPVHALIQECTERNNMVARAEEFGFVKASEL